MRLAPLGTIATAASLATLVIGGTAFARDIERSYDLQGFDAITVEGVYEVIVTVGGAYAITLSGEQKYMDLTEVGVEGDRLVLGTKNSKANRSWKGDAIVATISLPSLEAAALRGVGSLSVSGIDAEDFKASLEGVGKVALSGSCTDLTASVEGVGAMDAKDLECDRAVVSVEGIGSADVFAADAVDASVEGMGSIDVWGSPASVTKTKSLMSSVEIH